MDLKRDAMLVNLRLTSWTGRKHDRGVSDEINTMKGADPNAGRYNKQLFPPIVMKEITSIMGETRKMHYENTLPWDESGVRLLPVKNHDQYLRLMGDQNEKMIRERTRFIERYDRHIQIAEVALGDMFDITEYPTKERLTSKWQIRWRITPVPNADHFMAEIAAHDVDKVRRDIEAHNAERVKECVSHLYTRLAETIEALKARLQEGEDGNPLVFRNSIISNVRDVVEIIPTLNIFGDAELEALCSRVWDSIVDVDPDTLRPGKKFQAHKREEMKREVASVSEALAGYFGSPA